MSARLCLVEDDPTIQEILSERLRNKGFDVDVFENAERVLQSTKNWELYILDVKLEGDMSGLELCAKLKKTNASTPILILSALSEPTDRIEGLRVGADDYLGKPFEMEELLLRVNGMLKRRSWYQRMPQDLNTFSWAGYKIDFLKYEATSMGKIYSLSQKECMLMKFLIEREGQVVSRDEILDLVWGYHVFPSNRTVDNFILRLRKFFEKNPKKPMHIHSVRGMGYKFTSKESH